MSIRLEHWSNPEEILLAKLEADLEYRKREVEPEYSAAERALEYEGGLINTQNTQQVNPLTGTSNTDGDVIAASSNYIFVHHRMLLSQMSANPPYAGARPITSDEEDKQSAEAAEDVIRWWYQHANLQEISDLTCSKVLKYGTAFTKTINNPDKGEVLDFNEDTDEITMTGDADVYSPSVWDMWIDSTAIAWAEVEHMWERCWGSYEYWMSIFIEPEQQEILRKLKIAEDNRAQRDGRGSSENRFPLFYYYEKGMPRNAMKGRHAIITREGKMLTELMDNPHFYRCAMNKDEKVQAKRALAAGSPLVKQPKIAVFPYHILTDIDVDDRVYGRSFIYYEANGQDIINRLDNTQLDNIKAFGAHKVILVGAGDISAEALDNDQFNVLRVQSAGQVYHMNPPNSLPDIATLRASTQASGEGVAGVNDAMSGRIERETSASALQQAAAAGNQVRRRIFNKFANYTKSINQSLLMISKENWDEGRTLNVLGKNGQFKRKNIKAFDIEGGYDFYVSYGDNLTLDPALRRQEIMQLLPILQNAGAIKPHQIVELLNLNEVEALVDMSDLGKIRAKHLFEIMRVTNAQAPIDKEFEDHDSIIEFARYYFMTEEFLNERTEIQQLMRKHIMARMQIIASQSPKLTSAPLGPLPPAM